MVHGWKCDCRFPTEGRRRDAVQKGKLKCLAEYSRVKERKVEWVLRVNEDNEFYLHLKDIKGRRPPWSPWRWSPSFCPRLVEMEPFNFSEIPPEIQLMILRHLPSSDLGSCRLTCRSLNSLIEGNWNTLQPRYIGIVEFTPSGDVWCLRGSLRFYYKRKLESFNNVVIFFLILLFGELTTARIQSFTHILTQSRISIRRIVICNTPCRCELEHVVDLIESAHAKSLIIDVCGRIDLGKKLAMDPVIQRLQTVFIYSDGSDASYYMAEPFFSYDAITLEELRGLTEVWHMGSIKLLHLHMPSYGDWTTDTKLVLKAVGGFNDIRGNVLRTDGGQGLRVEVSDGRVTFYVERKRIHRPHV